MNRSAPPLPILALMNAIAYPLLILLTVGVIVFAPFWYAGIYLATRWEKRRVVLMAIWLYGRIWRVLMWPFVRFSKQNMVMEAFNPPCVVVTNHLSFFDVYCMGQLPMSDVTFVVRSWPFKMFWYAPFMRAAGYVDIESLSPEEGLAACRAAYNKGSTLLFFPEGHRSKDGRLGRFYSGAFKVAKALNARVTPLCITGTGTLLPPTRMTMWPARVQMRALEAVDSAGFTGELAHVEMRKHVKKHMKSALEEMRGERDAQ